MARERNQRQWVNAEEKKRMYDGNILHQHTKAKSQTIEVEAIYLWHHLSTHQIDCWPAQPFHTAHTNRSHIWTSPHTSRPISGSFSCRHRYGAGIAAARLPQPAWSIFAELPTCPPYIRAINVSCVVCSCEQCVRVLENHIIRIITTVTTMAASNKEANKYSQHELCFQCCVCSWTPSVDRSRTQHIAGSNAKIKFILAIDCRIYWTHSHWIGMNRHAFMRKTICGIGDEQCWRIE